MNNLRLGEALLIDRERPLGFRFEGRYYLGYAGDSVASALAANQVSMLSRSFKYHRPRGLSSLVGGDANTLLQIGDEPNVFADLRPLAEGMEITAQNYTGSLEKDREAWLSYFSRFLPVGFYYKAFFRPRGIWGWLWEPLFRKKTGLGTVDYSARAADCDKVYSFYDVAVVGGGPAGLAAALAAASAGAQTLVVEESPVLGGSLNWSRFADPVQQSSLGRELLDEIAGSPNIEILSGAVCTGWFADNWLSVIRGNRMFKVRARELVLATGTLEQHVVFRNNDLPGIMLVSTAQRLLKLYGICPGKKAVVLTESSEGYVAALDLADAGCEVVAVVDMRAEPPECTLSQEVKSRAMRTIVGSAVYEANSRGRRLDSVLVSSIVARGVCQPSSENLACDLLCMSGGRMPAYQLALLAGGKLSHDDDLSLFGIVDLPKHVQSAGSINGYHDLDALLLDGRRAGHEVATSLGLASSGPKMPPESSRKRPNFDWPIFPHPKGKEFVDFDEDLQISDILNACADGYDELELVKRYSTVGMGPSQGRHSALPTARIVAQATSRTLSECGVTTARPPLRPERLDVLAGRNFQPERRTAMHHRHLEAGASMMPVGLWWRPAFYGEKSQASECIRRETLAIRNGVGVIDVSTLGKIEVRGAEAGEFLDRVYTFSYKRQRVGTTRYLLMANEHGVVIDDGISARLSDKHYYITTTTGGADSIFRTLLWWNAQWQLDVDLANLTSAYAGINIAGPDSRAVLKTLCPGVDLSGEAFPYLAVQNGSVADIPARILRVGFVGELGYEVHVLAPQGEALWDAMLAAGREFQICSVGVEAQRQLRLEKGHVIIGQDTDANTTVHEIQMSWAIAKKEPCFAGGRSVAIRGKLPLRRKLVGFTCAGDGEAAPLESNLIIEAGEVVGHVTSAGYSPTLEKTVGLAFARPGVVPGDQMLIKLENGELVPVTVAQAPFYDPDNERQKM